MQPESNNSIMIIITAIAICESPNVHNQIEKINYKNDNHSKIINHEILYQSSMVSTSILTMNVTLK